LQVEPAGFTIEEKATGRISFCASCKVMVLEFSISGPDGSME
jgi:hypothetical protein